MASGVSPTGFVGVEPVSCRNNQHAGKATITVSKLEEGESLTMRGGGLEDVVCCFSALFRSLRRRASADWAEGLLVAPDCFMTGTNGRCAGPPPGTSDIAMER